MRDYELTMVLKASLVDQEREKLLEKLKRLVENAKGKVESQDLWGKKALAYLIKKEKEGIYVHLVLSLPEKETDPLGRKLKIEEGVLRHLLVRKD